MPRGRPPKPTQILRLQGTYEPGRHGRRVDEKLDVPGDLAESPPDLTDAQAAAWRYAIEHAPRGLLKRIDRAILKVWVEAEDRHHRAMVMQAKLDRDTTLPLLMKTENGLAPSPYLSIMDKCARTMARLCSELGFSPAARARLRATPDDDDPDDDDPETVSPWDLLKVIQRGRSEAV